MVCYHVADIHFHHAARRCQDPTMIHDLDSHRCHDVHSVHGRSNIAVVQMPLIILVMPITASSPKPSFLCGRRLCVLFQSTEPLFETDD